jgi:hypothetical protein
VVRPVSTRRVRASFVSIAIRVACTFPCLPESSSTAHRSDAVPSYLTMRKTLRRSCDLCAKSKLRCDLLLPQCSRCFKKSPSKSICVYANVPLSSLIPDDFRSIQSCLWATLEHSLLIRSIHTHKQDFRERKYSDLFNTVCFLAMSCFIFELVRG